MDTIHNRLPDADFFTRNAPRILGFAFGVLAPLILSALATVIYTGHGLTVEPVSPPPIYPNF